ncbi:hypothetical protein [uncultured Clostridium sp.]|uniref:hypothetical protein n=1 Tax=uncultured Clostridium sp. TaxID=59620 RepID=UPI0028ED0712|nr:hypothetical protein [uncultured Clostridium sp.]
MKKIILAAIAVSMLLTNVAFASSKTTYTNSTKNGAVSSVKQNNAYHLDSQDMD